MDDLTLLLLAISSMLALHMDGLPLMQSAVQKSADTFETFKNNE